MRDYEPYFTEDGSIGLYSFADKDVFHSKFGALTEAWEKFILPSDIEEKVKNAEEINVLDICYGIGYNTKALMTCAINCCKKDLKKKNIFQKIILKTLKIKELFDSIGTNNIFSKLKMLLPSIASIHIDNDLPSINIDCLEINKELVKLSPLFRTLKTPEEIFDIFVHPIFNCFETYYKIRRFFIKCIVPFYPKNKREINELLDLKFKNMHIEKAYKVNGLVNYILLNSLYEEFVNNYIDEEFKKTLRERKISKFLDKSFLKYASFNQKWGYKSSSETFLSTFLHNIYYRYLSCRYKNIDFKTTESLFKLNFFIKDARKTILTLDKEYDCIFLDAFTYTKAPQLWSIEFIAELYKRIKPTGLLLTYSNSALVRKTLLDNGFYVGKIYNKNENKFIGTIASKEKSLIKHPLSPYEIGLCNTKAGIPYHDPGLKFSKKEIIELREYEFRHSSLQSSSQYMKTHSNKEEDGEQV